MKIFFALLVLSMSAFAQYRPGPYYPGPSYPYPGGYFPGPYYPDYRTPEDFCTKDQLEVTTALVQKECELKVTEFSTENQLTCKFTKVGLNGCRAACYNGEEQTARLRLDVNSNCLKQTASLRKTVITWY